MIDLSHNETCAYLALALEGGGLPQGVTRILARYAVDAGLVEAALEWRPEALPTLIKNLPPPSRPRRQTLDPELWARIKALAAHTYVPESETSKLSGAGAGINDND